MPNASFHGTLGASGLIGTVTAPIFGAAYSATNLPCALQAGETLRDNMPTGVTVVNASTYSSSNDLYVVLKAVEAAVSTGVYVQLDAKVYYINNFDGISSQFNGYINANKEVMGLIGQGYDKTFIRVVPTAMQNTQNTQTVNGTSYTSVSGAVAGAVMSTGLYFSNSNSAVPLFFSGICFQGTLQTPYTAISGFSVNNGTASPLPWYGWTIWAGIAGSRVQFCRFQGFGFALQASPPYECGFVNTNHNNGLTWARCDMDGRVAPELDSTNPVASGGLMWDRENLTYVQDSWLHHTRRSGFATHTDTSNTSENYVVTNFQVDNIANTADSWEGSGLGFNGSNIEEVIGTITYNNCYFTITNGSHINYALPYSSSANTPVVYSEPDHVIITVNGFRTDNTGTSKSSSNYGGCLVIAVSKTPNSRGTSPAWQSLSDNGIAGAGFIVVNDNNGNPLTGVRGSSWVAGTHTPDKYFVVVY